MDIGFVLVVIFQGGVLSVGFLVVVIFFQFVDIFVVDFGKNNVIDFYFIFIRIFIFMYKINVRIFMNLLNFII